MTLSLAQAIKTIDGQSNSNEIKGGVPWNWEGDYKIETRALLRHMFYHANWKTDIYISTKE